MTPSDQGTAISNASAALKRLSELAGQRFTSSGDATSAVLSTISDVLGMRTSWVSQIDVDDDRLTVEAAQNAPNGCDVQPGSTSPLPETFCWNVIGGAEAHPVIIEDVRQDPEFAASNAARAFPAIGSYVGVPIVLADGTIYGTLCASDPDPRQIDPQQSELVTVLSRLLATQIERDREYAARSRAEQQFEDFMDHSPVAAYMKDEHGRYVYINSLFQRAFGVSREELLGKTDRDWLASPDEAAAIEENDRHIRQTGASDEFIETVQAPDGSRQHWYSFKFPIRDASGATWTGGVSADITERRNRELERARLAAIVADSQDAMYGRTLDGIVTSWNPAAEAMYGYSSADIVGKPLNILVPEDMPSDQASINARVAQGERIVQYQTRRRTRDGRILDVELTLSPIRDADGGIAGISTIARNVTERNRLLAERERLYTELQEELARAAEIQAHLLPDALPVLAGFEFAASCIPAREVGGDFFDWTGEPGKVRLSLGDVTGKGMPAALLMATTRAALRAASVLPVAEAITTVNRVLSRDLGQSDAFVTMFHAELGPDGEVSYTDAGHGMAVIIRRDGSATPLSRPDVPVGILEETTYSAGTARLGPGDALLVYSDGLPDARPDLGLENPCTVAKLCGTPTDIHAALHNLVQLSSGRGARPDDLTIILVRRREESE